MREYEYDPDHQQESQAASEGLRSDAQAKRSQLDEWSATAYGEVHCHACAVHSMTHTSICHTTLHRPVHPSLVVQKSGANVLWKLLKHDMEIALDVDSVETAMSSESCQCSHLQGSCQQTHCGLHGTSRPMEAGQMLHATTGHC